MFNLLEVLMFDLAKGKTPHPSGAQLRPCHSTLFHSLQCTPNDFMPFSTSALHSKLYHSEQSTPVPSVISPDSGHDRQFLLPTISQWKTMSEDTRTQRRGGDRKKKTKKWCRRKERRRERGANKGKGTWKAGKRETNQTNPLSLAVRHWPLKYFVGRGVSERKRQQGWRRKRDRWSILKLNQWRIKASLSYTVG